MTQTDPAGPTAVLARFAAGLAPADIPAAVAEHAKLAVLDVLGCALYGSTRPWARIVRADVLADGARPAAALWGSPLRSSPALAALVNATAAHSAELDDLNKQAFFHPSAAAVPAALAIADVRDAPTGAELLAAVVAGYEVGSRVGRALGQGHFLAGYHPQGTCGVFTAAAAAGRMHGLGAQVMRHALGTAGTQAFGLMSAQEGSMVKRLHAGFAAQAGVRAVTLAARGFTGIANVLEAEFGGLVGTLGTLASDLAALTAGLGDRWETTLLEFKQHAACAAVHTSLDVAEDLRTRWGIDPDDIESVDIECTTHSRLHCGFEYRPAGATAAQMSFQYCVAAMLRFGVVSPAQFTDDLLADPAMLALAERVHVHADPALDAAGPDQRHAVRVAVRLCGGVAHEGSRLQRRGEISEPLALSGLEQKYRELAGSVLPAPAVEELRELVGDLEHLPDARRIGEVLQSARDPA